MAGKYQAYPQYKDSSVEWLGGVPKHWLSTELKRYSYVQGGYAFSSDSFIDFGKAVIRISDIKQDGNVSLDSCKYVESDGVETYSQYEVRNGDILMAMTGATIGKAGWFMEIKPALLNQRVGSFKCNARYLDYKFFWYVLNSFGYQEYIKLTAFGGAQPNISDSGMVGYMTAFPPIVEQQKVANFLDHETAKIDTLIAKQQQLIALLKEKRQAVISHAVTKGLNPNAPMRDSGVEWLGEVPAHWSVKRLKFAAINITQKVSIGDKKTIALENIESWTGRYIATGSLYSGDDVEFTSGDVLFGKLRPYLAKVYFADESGVAFGDLLVYRPKQILFGKFCFYQMLNEDFIDTVDSSTYGSKMPRASVDFISNMAMVLPPVEEQKEIVKYIESVLAKFDEIEIKAKSAINLIQERRTALISAAVTGKIDVRGWQAPESLAQVEQQVSG